MLFQTGVDWCKYQFELVYTYMYVLLVWLFAQRGNLARLFSLLVERFCIGFKVWTLYKDCLQNTFWAIKSALFGDTYIFSIHIMNCENIVLEFSNCLYLGGHNSSPPWFRALYSQSVANENRRHHLASNCSIYMNVALPYLASIQGLKAQLSLLSCE